MTLLPLATLALEAEGCPCVTPGVAGTSILRDQAPWAHSARYCSKVGMDSFLLRRSDNLYPAESGRKLFCSSLLTFKDWVLSTIQNKQNL